MLWMLLRPKPLCLRFPCLGVGSALFAEMLRALRHFQIGRVRAALGDHFRQKLRVFRHRAGAKMVAVEGLTGAVEPEKRLLKTFKEALVPDVRFEIVVEHAGLHVARGVDEAVNSPARDARRHWQRDWTPQICAKTQKYANSPADATARCLPKKRSCATMKQQGGVLHGCEGCFA